MAKRANVKHAHDHCEAKNNSHAHYCRSRDTAPYLDAGGRLVFVCEDHREPGMVAPTRVIGWATREKIA